MQIEKAYGVSQFGNACGIHKKFQSGKKGKAPNPYGLGVTYLRLSVKVVNRDAVNFCTVSQYGMAGT